METIVPIAVLLFYDYPQVFIGKSIVDQHYCCSVVSESEAGPSYFCVPISAQRRDALTVGQIDLRSVFESPEIPIFYAAQFGQQNIGSITLTREAFDSAPDNLLPKPGLVFLEYDEVASKAQELNATIAFASLSVPEAEKNTRIRSSTLAQFLTSYQAVVKLLCKRVAKEHKGQPTTDPTVYGLDVFGFSHGSFTVHLRSTYGEDIFGDNHVLTRALELLGEFLNNTSNPEAAIAYLHSVRGHTASSLIRLLEFLDRQQCPLAQRWSSPRLGVSYLSKTSPAGIRELIELCRQHEDLTEEIVTLTGPVVSASIDGNTWRLLNDEDGVQYRGDVAIDANISMSGIVIQKQKYRFQCRESIDVNVGTGKETAHLSVFYFEPISA